MLGEWQKKEQQVVEVKNRGVIEVSSISCEGVEERNVTARRGTCLWYNTCDE